MAAAPYIASHEAIIKTVQLIVAANEAELTSVHLPVELIQAKNSLISLLLLLQKSSIRTYNGEICQHMMITCGQHVWPLTRIAHNKSSC